MDARAAQLAAVALLVPVVAWIHLAPPAAPPAAHGGSRGVLLVATGDAALREALFAAYTVRRLHPELPVAVFTDAGAAGRPEAVQRLALLDGVEVRLVDDDSEFFALPFAEGQGAGPLRRHQIEHLTGYWTKMRAIQASPFAETVFLDADTALCRRCLDELFALLGRVDYAATLAPNIRNAAWKYPADVPGAWADPNTGVLAFRRSSAMLRVFAEWERVFVEAALGPKPGSDQPAFAVAAFRTSDVVGATLAHVWNCRPADVKEIGEEKLLAKCESGEGGLKDCRILHMHGLPDKLFVQR